MTLLKISRMGHPVLRRRAAPVIYPIDPSIKKLAQDMVATMYDADGIGLAAPQVYASVRLIVLRVPATRTQTTDEEPVPDTAIVNPVFEPLDDTVEFAWEGCLSIPGLRGLVPRHARIRYWGVTPDGMTLEREATGLHARVVQHEVDHLDGILYLDRMTDLTKLSFEDQLKHIVAPKDEKTGPET